MTLSALWTSSNEAKLSRLYSQSFKKEKSLVLMRLCQKHNRTSILSRLAQKTANICFYPRKIFMRNFTQATKSSDKAVNRESLLSRTIVLLLKSLGLSFTKKTMTWLKQLPQTSYWTEKRTHHSCLAFLLIQLRREFSKSATLKRSNKSWKSIKVLLRMSKIRKPQKMTKPVTTMLR